MANASCEHEYRSARLGCRGDGYYESLLTHPGEPTAVDKREPSSVAFSRLPRPHSVRCLSGAAGW